MTGSGGLRGRNYGDLVWWSFWLVVVVVMFREGRGLICMYCIVGGGCVVLRSVIRLDFEKWNIRRKICMEYTGMEDLQGILYLEM